MNISIGVWEWLESKSLNRKIIVDFLIGGKIYGENSWMKKYGKKQYREKNH